MFTFSLELYTYTAAQKFGISKIFNIFFLKDSSAQGCIYLIKNTEFFYLFCEILLQFKITVFYFNII